MGKHLRGNLKEVKRDLIDRPGMGIRLDISDEAVQELAANIAENGLLQPIVVCPKGERFEVIAGDRRYLATGKLGWDKIPCIVREAKPREVAVSRASENLARVDLTPVEEAAIYKDLVETHSLNYDEVGKMVGKSPGLIRRRMDLLKMPPQLQQEVHKGTISIGVAEELWRFRDTGTIDYYLSFCVDHGATVSVVREWVKDFQRRKESKEGDVVGGGGGSAPYEPRPIYVSCDLCQGPFELGQETVIRACPGCADKIKSALRG